MATGDGRWRGRQRPVGEAMVIVSTVRNQTTGEMQSRRNPPCAGDLITFLLCSLLLSKTVTARPFVLVLSQDDLKD
ncbi:hypothetical protein L1987_23771 [Smallanthus sonchifolius]|uniref:Uncharacterized protein n=1 Tax=Smallanthus sonchifolius TaxID=185202 RepID=A0ACB9IK31_9ASTR|nr:hypothetical protein L1987_23771 [Smallanthus sonchifolius]